MRRFNFISEPFLFWFPLCAPFSYPQRRNLFWSRSILFFLVYFSWMFFILKNTIFPEILIPMRAFPFLLSKNFFNFTLGSPFLNFFLYIGYSFLSEIFLFQITLFISAFSVLEIFHLISNSIIILYLFLTDLVLK